MSRAETIEKGQRVKRLMDDDDLQQAFQDVYDALHKGIDETPSDDMETIIGLKIRLSLLDGVKKNLMRAIEDGKFEEYQDEQEQRPPFLGDIRKWQKPNR